MTRIKHWTARRSRRRVAGYWEVTNTRGVVAIVYTTQADAELMAVAPKLLGSLKHLTAIVRMHEGELRASERAKYEAARALVNELEGN
jgi:hypothetical protein